MATPIVKSADSEVNCQSACYENSIELLDGQIFKWESSPTSWIPVVSEEEMEKRIILFSQNPPKMISRNQTIASMINEIALVSPLWHKVIVSPQRDFENRATIFFFEAVAQKFAPLRLFFEKCGNFNRYSISSEKAELMARELRFFIRRLAHRPEPEFWENRPLNEELESVVELNFSGYRLGFLPDEIGLFENLYTLNLEGCDLAKIPASIGNLKKLQYLKLSGSPISSTSILPLLKPSEKELILITNDSKWVVTKNKSEQIVD